MHLLNLPNDVLRNYIFHSSWSDDLILLICRFVCKRLRNIMPHQKIILSSNYIACSASVSIIEWAKKLYPEFDIKKIRIENVTERGNLEILKYLINNGHVKDNGLMAYAALGGHLHILQWGVKNNCPINDTACSYAAINGHLELLIWLRENGYPWTSNVCTYAARGNHFDILQWAKINGCPWDADTC